MLKNVLLRTRRTVGDEVEILIKERTRVLLTPTHFTYHCTAITPVGRKSKGPSATKLREGNVLNRVCLFTELGGEGRGRGPMSSLHMMYWTSPYWHTGTPPSLDPPPPKHGSSLCRNPPPRHIQAQSIWDLTVQGTPVVTSGGQDGRPVTFLSQLFVPNSRAKMRQR